MKSLPQTSPFNSIRHQDEQGEYWMGRELAKLMGYTKWQNFEKPIKSAIENMEFAGDSTTHHITASSKMVERPQGGGSIQEDYRLSRYGCYMIALCCDGRKIEVASAKKYFAVKTREAETIIPVQGDRLEEQRLRIRELELQVELTKETRYLMEKREAVATMNTPHLAALVLGAQVIELPPEVVEKTVVVDPTGKKLASFDGVGIGYIRDRYGFRNNGEAWGWLESIGYSKVDKWIQELTAVQSAKLPREELNKLDQLFQLRQGNRQMLLGE